VYQADVRSLACRRLDRFPRIGRLGADSAAGVLECAAHAGAFARRGVRDEYPDGWATERVRCSGPAEAVLSAGFGKGLARSHGRNRGPHWTKSRAAATWDGEAVAASPSPLAVSAISLHRIMDGDVAVRDGLARKGGSAPGVRPWQALCGRIAVADHVRSDGRRSAVVLDHDVDLGALEPGELARRLRYLRCEVGRGARYH